MSGTVASLFATRLYETALGDDARSGRLLADLAAETRALAAEDRAGRAWCKANSYRGYTSYASLDDLPRRSPSFAELKRRLDRHAGAFAEALDFDLGAGRLRLDSLWVNVLKPGAAHSGHVHPHSVLSGTLYLETPPGSGAIRFEDPRLGLMMAAPPRRADAPEEARSFVRRQPSPGLLLLWESWLRHEVEANAGRGERLSVSFNYSWG